MLPRLPLFLGLCTCLSSWAATYHVAADGDDSRAPAVVSDPATPWKTLAKVQSRTFVPGDSILLRRGDTWREALTLKQSGTAALPIHIGAYGTATEAPTLDGTLRIPGTSTGNLRIAKLSDPRAVKTVLVGRDPIPVSRFPDTGWIQASRTENDLVVVAPGLAGTDWTGASIHLRTAMWTLETHRVLRQEGERLTLDAKAIYSFPDSVRFFLSNHPSAIGARPSWAFTSKDSTLRWSGASATVDAALVPTLLDISWQDHIHVRGLRFRGSTAQALKSAGAGIRIEDCDFEHPGLVGITTDGADVAISGNTIRGATNSAIIARGQRQRIEANTLRDNATPSIIGPDGMGDGCCGGYGILYHGDSSILARNTIDSTGYNGLGFFGQSILVEENEIAHSCMSTDDCGGIYTITGLYANPGAQGSVVRRNVVRDAVGAPGGWRGAWAASQGIYLDDGSHDIDVDSNIAWGNTNGLYLHNTRRVGIRGNTFFANRASPVQMTHDNLAGAGDMFANSFESNLFVGLLGQGAYPTTQMNQAQTVEPAAYQGNTSCSDQGVVASCSRDGRTLWRRSLLSDNDPRLGPELQRSGTYDTTVWGWDTYPTQVKATQDSGTRCAKGKCLRVANTGPANDIYAMTYCGFTFPTEKNQVLRLSFQARGRDPLQDLTLTLRRSGGDWAILGFSSAVPLDTAWTLFEILVRAPSSEPAARLEFHSSQADSVYWIDEVTLRAVPDSLFRNSNLPVLLTHSTPMTPSPTLGSGAWMDAWGTTLGTAPSLAPYTSHVAFPYQGTSAALTPRRTTGALRILRQGSSWSLSGLTAPCTVVDLRGRTLETLVPDDRGQAHWTPPPGAGLVWLHGPQGTVALPGVR
jgi:parallel beta-helix repeat protein